MPFDRSKYPANWEAIRTRILGRADGCCECSGQCGDVHDGGRCNVPNSATIQRDPKRPAQWVKHHGCSLCLGGDPECRSVRVVLTCAHLDHDKGDDESRIIAACQRCHFLIDKAQHIENARKTRMRRKAIGFLRGVL